MARQELARFLPDRREGLRPVGVGLPAGPRRRTPGLRREEVASLTSMFIDYYALSSRPGAHTPRRGSWTLSPRALQAAGSS